MSARCGILEFDCYTTDPAQLAREIEQALQDLGLGKPDRLFQHITFREGELMMIVQALRQSARKHKRA